MHTRACPFRPLAAAMIFGLSHLCFAGPELWVDPRNPEQPLRASLSGVYGPLVVLTTATNSTRMLELAAISGKDAARVADFLEKQPPRSTIAQPVGKFTRELSGNLERLRNRKLEALRESETPEPLFYVLYFSAGWCGPCHRFTPLLVESYLKEKTPTTTDFEVIFVSSDEGRGAMIAYMESMKMPWPVLAYERVNDPAFRRYAGDGIPCLAVVDRNGALLFHSYVNREYRGADEPWERFLKFRVEASPDSPTAQWARFRLLCNSRAGRTPDGSVAAELFASTPLDPRPFQEAGITSFAVTVVVDHDGGVVSATANDIPGIPAYYAESKIRQWLFLPKTDHGKNVRSTLTIPIKIPARTAQ